MAADYAATLLERRGKGSIGEVSGTCHVNDGSSVALRKTELAVVVPSDVEGPAGFSGERDDSREGGGAAQGGGLYLRADL